MSIAELRLKDGGAFRVGGDEVPEPFQNLVRFGILASAQEPFDPMEKAFHQVGSERTNKGALPDPEWNLVRAWSASGFARRNAGLAGGPRESGHRR
jgi:Ca2+-transporting ATPase